MGGPAPRIARGPASPELSPASLTPFYLLPGGGPDLAQILFTVTVPLQEAPEWLGSAFPGMTAPLRVSST